MPVVQQQMSSFASKMGGKVAQANVEHKDKPIDTGNQRLPAGIRNGVAKLSSMYTKEYADDSNGPGTKGQTFFRASAIVVSPLEVNGQKCAGGVTSVIIPLCDMPAKGQRKAKPFSDNWYEFQNLFKLLGITPPNETLQTDPTGQRTEAYYFAAMKTLVDPARPPVYISFSTRGWTPPKSAAQPNPTEMVFEEWHGLTEYNEQHDPAVVVQDNTSAPPSSPPSPSQTFNEFTPPASEAAVGTVEAFVHDLADEVAALVEVAMNDPEGATEEGSAASAQLEKLAWAAGWTTEQTAKAANWEAVGDMALNPPDKAPPTTTMQGTIPEPSRNGVAVGSKYKFAKRTKDGSKLKNNKGEEFPPQEVEVVTVDPASQTCTLKSVKDGKDVVDIRSKQPIPVKFEWLE